MSLDLLKEKGVPLDQQRFTWKELAGPGLSKLNDDAFSRVRVILLNGVESQAVRFSHQYARMNEEARVLLAQVRRIDHHQQTQVNWLIPADHSPLETTLGFEQVAVEVTAHVAEHEPDPYLAQGYRFGMLEDFDHLYRFAALYDRLEGKDPNNLLQSYTDLLPGRPTAVEHRAPEDDVRRPYAKGSAQGLSKLNALLILAAEHQTRDYYMVIGPQFADPVARMLYAEIASIEEQHVTHYESFPDPREGFAEKWLLHEATEVWAYWSALQTETNPTLKALWHRFADYELGQLQVAIDHFQKVEGRDAAEVLPERLPDAIGFASHRKFVRETLLKEVDLRARGQSFVPAHTGETQQTLAYRAQLNKDGSPSEIVAQRYRWSPGTELSATATSPERRMH